MSALLFDIGGTKLRMARGEGDSVTDVQKVPTPAQPAQAIAALAAYAKEFIPDLTSASGGIAGIVEDGMVRASPNLAEWDGFAFADALRAALSVPVQIANDADMAALGEATYGAGKGHSSVAYIGVGTGIGGSLIIEGNVAPYAHDFEPGHQVLDAATGTTFEEMASGAALEHRFGAAAKDLPREAYESLTPALAAGIYNLILLWSPEIVVLGGSVMNEENGYQVAAVKHALNAIPTLLPEFPQLAHSALGDENGLFGALAASKQEGVH